MKHVEQATIKRLETAAGDEWWNSLTKKQQKDYIALHPNSKYAKKAKKTGGKGAGLTTKPAKTKKPKADKPAKQPKEKKSDSAPLSDSAKSVIDWERKNAKFYKERGLEDTDHEGKTDEEIRDYMINNLDPDSLSNKFKADWEKVRPALIKKLGDQPNSGEERQAWRRKANELIWKKFGSAEGDAKAKANQKKIYDAAQEIKKLQDEWHEFQYARNVDDSSPKRKAERKRILGGIKRLTNLIRKLKGLPPAKKEKPFVQYD